MKNIKQITGNWEARLHERCDKLTHKQRIRIIWIFSTAYLLLTAASLIWIYREGNKRQFPIGHIQNPLHANKKQEPERLPDSIHTTDFK